MPLACYNIGPRTTGSAQARAWLVASVASYVITSLFRAAGFKSGDAGIGHGFCEGVIFFHISDRWLRVGFSYLWNTARYLTNNNHRVGSDTEKTVVASEISSKLNCFLFCIRHKETLKSVLKLPQPLYLQGPGLDGIYRNLECILGLLQTEHKTSGRLSDDWSTLTGSFLQDEASDLPSCIGDPELEGLYLCRSCNWITFKVLERLFPSSTNPKRISGYCINVRLLPHSPVNSSFLIASYRFLTVMWCDPYWDYVALTWRIGHQCK